MKNWSCSLCSFINHIDLGVCEVCEQKKYVPEINSLKANVVVQPTTNSGSDLFSVLVIALTKSPVSSQLCSPPALFFSQRDSFGSEWSCGYRNIQMMYSSLKHIPLYRNSLFNCDGCIPDVMEIQRWIELAWMSGFDAEGAEQLGHLVGNPKWIGATECATLFRFFGIRARVVDFSSVSKEDLVDSNITAGIKKCHDGNSKQLFKRAKLSSAGTQLFEWLSRYFVTCPKTQQFAPPVYLQHDGHSRSIVGVTRIKDSSDIDSCLIFDPACSCTGILQNLQEAVGGGRNVKWHRTVKKPRHLFNKDQYQIVYIEEGLMTEVERTLSKQL